MTATLEASVLRLRPNRNDGAGGLFRPAARGYVHGNRERLAETFRNRDCRRHDLAALPVDFFGPCALIYWSLARTTYCRFDFLLLRLPGNLAKQLLSH